MNIVLTANENLRQGRRTIRITDTLVNQEAKDNMKSAINSLLRGKEFYYSLHIKAIKELKFDYPDWIFDSSEEEEAIMWGKMLSILRQNSVIIRNQYIKWIDDTTDGVRSILLSLDENYQNMVFWSILVLWRDFYIETNPVNSDGITLSLKNRFKDFNDLLPELQRFSKEIPSKLARDRKEKYWRLIIEDAESLYRDSLLDHYDRKAGERKDSFSNAGISSGEMFKKLLFNQIENRPLRSVIALGDSYMNKTLNEHLSAGLRQSVNDNFISSFGIESLRGKERLDVESIFKTYRRIMNAQEM